MSSEGIIKFGHQASIELTEDDAVLSGKRGAQLLLAIGKQPKPPCMDTGNGKPCAFFRRCGTEQLACKSFYAYTRQAVHRKEYEKWLELEKKPTARMYEKTYRPDPKEA